MNADKVAKARRKLSELREPYSAVGGSLYVVSPSMYAAPPDLLAVADAVAAVKAAQVADPNDDPIGWGVEVHRKVADLDAALERFAGTGA